MNRLITIRISHYNEKARWALDRLGVPYREQPYMPLFHFLPVALATWRRSDAAPDHVSTRFSTPVLITDDGTRICDSSRIVQWASERFAGKDEDLYPDPDCHRLDRRFSDELGEHTRRLAYYWALGDASGVRAVARANVGRTQAAMFSALYPVGSRLLRKSLSIDFEHAKRSRQVVLEQVLFASERLGGRRYLVGGRFSAADLTLACMLAPVLLVSREEGYGAVLPPIDGAHPEAVAFARELRDTPAGAHAMRMFGEERGPGGRFLPGTPAADILRGGRRPEREGGRR